MVCVHLWVWLSFYFSGFERCLIVFFMHKLKHKYEVTKKKSELQKYDPDSQEYRDKWLRQYGVKTIFKKIIMLKNLHIQV